MRQARWMRTLLMLLVGIVMAACGPGPTDPDSAVVLLDLAFPPDSSAAPVPVSGIRVHVRDAATDAVLLTHDLQVEEGVPSRTVALEIKQYLHRSIIFEVELLGGAPSTVLWIGRTESMTLEEGDDPRPEVDFARPATLP